MTNVTLEGVLKEYFGCDNMRDEYGEVTPEGRKAYGRLVKLLEDVDVLSGIGVSGHIIQVLDEVAGDPQGLYGELYEKED